MVKKLLTQKELKRKQNLEKNIKYVTIINKSKQCVHIQLSPPKNVDFYRGEQTIMIGVGKSGKFPENRLKDAQIKNLIKKSVISTH